MDKIELILLVLISLIHNAKGVSVFDLEYRGEACDGQSALYNCPYGYFIKVMAATYGRSNNVTCTSTVPAGKATDTMCETEGAVDTMRDRCDGRQSCGFVVSDTFNDTHCEHVHNYLDIVFICEAGLFSALACEGYKLNLVCPGEEVLHINSLEYGRSDNDTCQHPSINMTDCVTSEPLEQVSNLCNGRPDCSIFIYNNLLGDPCPGTYKYLLLDHLCGTCENLHNDADCEYFAEIGECEKNVNWMAVNCRRSCWNCKYTDKCLDRHEKCPYWASIGECHVNPGWMTNNCRKSCNLCYLLLDSKLDKQTSVTKSLCEGGYLYMTCPPSYSLRIEEVRFGRWDNSTCLSERVNDTEYDCHTPEGTVEKVRVVCEGRVDCWFEARVELFGDSCPGMNKQSEVTFTCQKCEDSFEETECQALKAAGRCESDYDWMMDHCFKTCTLCHYRDCGNKADQGKDIYDCDYWAIAGYCDTNRDNVHEKCATSCQKCEEPEPTTTPVPVPDGPKSEEICETEVVLLQCPTDQHIQMDYVFFGRDDNATCPHSTDQDTDCPTQQKSESVMRMLCDGRTECHFEANAVILGNPCPQTYKIGRVIYQCKECVNNASDAECEEMLMSDQCTTDYANAMMKCYKTCSNCELRVCGNLHESKVDCDFFAARGDCQTRPNPMHIDCKESCERCDVPNPDELESESREMCEGGEALLSCPTDYFLHINSMFYGREDNDTCHHDSVTRFNCSTTEGALPNIRKVCNGRKKCWFEARSSLWGDNCKDMYKSASVNYTCQVCANTAPDASCRVWEAKGLCVDDYDYMMQNCYKTCSQCDTSSCGTSYSSVKDCDYWAARGECQVNPDFMLSKCKESCHACVDPVTTTTPAPTTTPHPDQLEPVRENICEWQVRQMLCPEFYFLRVRDIFFGRVDPNICPHDNILNTNCQTPEGALEKAQRVCDGRTSCWFEAKSWVWGDNCEDTFKTGSVEYSCQLCKNLDSDERCEELAGQGRCDTEYEYMMNHCFKSCSSCAESTCENQHISSAACDSWAIVGECSVNPNFMLPECAASCRSCEVAMTTTPPAPDCEGSVECEHGHCEEMRCVCDDGWTGDTCDTFYCISNCTGHGRCYGPNQCACEPYYQGADCSSCSVTYQAGSVCLPCPFCQQGSCAENPDESLVSSYIGCFTDDEVDREYSYMELLTDGVASPVVCINLCARKGYKYAALQNNDRCQCGDSFGKHGPSSACTHLCTDEIQICGGSLANSVYRTWQGKCTCWPNWEGKFCTECVGSNCPDSTTTAEVIATSPFTLSIILQEEWNDVYSDLNNPQTKEFIRTLTSAILTFLKEIEPKASRVQIVQLRQGSVDVEYLVWFSEPVTKAEQDDMECAVYDSLAENNGQMGDRQARASSRMVDNCEWRKDYCKNGGELYRANNVWNCKCPKDTRGDQCETSGLELGILIGIIVACCVVFLLILILIICCLQRRRSKEPESRAIMSEPESTVPSATNSTANLKDQMELSYQYPDITEGTAESSADKRSSNGLMKNNH